ncbi:MAG: AAA family ATPase, partial [Thermoleophilia bacterium]|nr:AAA family ATPase [Thermoleophilia bacterium]
MLRRIRLKGFKSFSGQTDLELGSGVNVVVGPNGSGKSNLAEAIVWALGEQRSGRLRASGMAEVLHAGGQGAQAQIAEVEVVLESGERSTEPAELSVSRRLTRAGDASYRLNGQGCRLLDVQDALAGKGLGPDAFAIIRQGQVDAICNSKPVERRAMVEEAAGVAAAKRRRRRAERKLGRIRESVERARDLEEELALQGRRLTRQASAANRAARLDRELAVARATLLDRRIEAARAEEQSMQTVRTTGREQLAAARSACDEARTAVQTLEQAREASGGRARDADRLAMVVRAEADRISGRADLARERQAQERERAQRMGRERDEAVARLDDLRPSAQEADNAALSAAASLESAEGRAQAAESASEAARRAASELRDQATMRTTTMAALEREREELRRTSEQAEALLTSARARIGDEGDSDAEALARAERREEISTARQERWRERRATRDAAADDAHAALAAAQERRRSADARLRALPSLVDASDSSLSADLIVSSGYERAVAAALGAAADAELVENTSEGVAAVDEGAGAAIVPAPTRTAIPPGLIATCLVDVIESCAERARPHLARLLADVWLVDDLSEVPSDASGVFVTSAGHVYRPTDGVIIAPVGALAARAARQRAEAEVDAASRAVSDAEAASANADAERARCLRRARAAERAATRAAQALAAVRAEHSGRLRRQEDARAQVVESERELAEV